MFYKGRGMLRRNPIVKVLLSLALVLVMISQLALPAMADMVVENVDPGFMPTSVSTTSTTVVTLYTYTVPANSTATFIQVGTTGAVVDYIYVYVNGTLVLTSYNTYASATNITAAAGSVITINGRTTSGGTLVMNANDGIGNHTLGSSPSFLLLSYDAANQSTAQAAASNASTAATNAANAYSAACTAAGYASNAYNAANTAASNASTAATNASTAATNASNAYNAANTASSNTTNDPAAATAITNTTNGMAKTFTAANTASTNTTNDPAADTAIISSTNGMAATYNNTTYGGESAAQWANQAATAASNNIVPVISSVIGQNGATCTTSGSFTAIVAVTPSSGVTYTVTGVPGCSSNGNSLTFSGLSHGTAYTADITATYTSDGKTCMYPFTFFSI